MQILPLKAKPLSTFTNEEGLRLLLGPTHPKPTSQSFPKAELDAAALLDVGVTQVTGFRTVEDLLSHLGADLAFKCMHSGPSPYTKQYANREIISPILHAASLLAGNPLNPAIAWKGWSVYKVLLNPRSLYQC